MSKAENVKRAAALTARIAKVMGWESGHTSHVFEIWRKTGKAEAVAVGLDKLEQIAAALERRRKRR